MELNTGKLNMKKSIKDLDAKQWKKYIMQNNKEEDNKIHYQNSQIQETSSKESLN